MTGLDWTIVGFAVLLGCYGYLQGFIVGAMSLAGFALGAFLGTRLAPLVLNQGSESQYAPLLGLGGALLVGAVFANVLELLGSRARLSERSSVLRWVDGLMGAALTGCVALGIAWIVGAVALDSSSSTPLRDDIRGSEILRALDKVLPPSGPVLDALARIDPLPSVHGPAATVPPPTRAILRSRAVRRAGRSVVRVYGMACGLGIEGSGWDVGPGLVVTNAHVVAGEDHTEVQVGGIGPDLAGRSSASTSTMTSRSCACRGCGCRRCRSQSRSIRDRGRDPRLSPRRRLQRPARADRPDRRGPHPERLRPRRRGALDHAAARQGPARELRWPVIDAHGQVLATVFAAITNTSRPGGFAIPNGLVAAQVRAARARHLRPVGNGHCAE